MTDSDQEKQREPTTPKKQGNRKGRGRRSRRAAGAPKAQQGANSAKGDDAQKDSRPKKRQRRGSKKSKEGAARQASADASSGVLKKIDPQQLKTWTARARARADLYEILSLFFQEVPSADLLAIFKHSDFMEIVRLLLSEATLERWQAFSKTRTSLESLQTRLRMEYNNLFLVPTSQRFEPRESTFFFAPGNPDAPKKRVEAVQKYLRRIGMTPMAKFKEKPDHLSQMLHFMNVLCEREKDHLEKKNAAQLESICQLQLDFTRKHLSVWAEAFRTRMYHATRFRLLRDIADLLAEFLVSDAEWTPQLAELYQLRQKPGRGDKPRSRSGAAPSQEKPRKAEGTGDQKPRKRRRRRPSGGRRRGGGKAAGEAARGGDSTRPKQQSSSPGQAQ